MRPSLDRQQRKAKLASKRRISSTSPTAALDPNRLVYGFETKFADTFKFAQNAPWERFFHRCELEGGAILTPLTEDMHLDDALELAQRAHDYVSLEIGRAPDNAYVQDFFRATPPDVPPSDLSHYGIRKGRKLAGMVGIAEGYEFPEDWWIGLLLIDPAFRNRGIGRKVVQNIQDRARRHGIAALKLSVLYANPKGLKFWLREGFVHHRDAPATPTSDGHDRVVLKYQL